MSKGSRLGTLTRTLKILQFVATRRFGATAAEIAEEIGCTKRNVYHTLACLEEAGIRIMSDQSWEKFGRKCRWKIVGQQEFLRRIGII